MNGQEFVGKVHQFPDGDKIEVFQVKQRGPEQYLISFYIYQGPGIPRKLVMTLEEFKDTYGHLFIE
jgi:hypothetical protein